MKLLKLPQHSSTWREGGGLGEDAVGATRKGARRRRSSLLFYLSKNRRK